MPFAPKKQLDNEQDQTTGGAPNISGVSTSINVPGQGAQTSKAPKSSGQYQNIEKYLQANQQQGQQMGEQVAGQVQQKVTGAEQATQKLGSEVQKVQAYDPSKILTNLPQASDVEKQAYKTTKQTGGYTGASDIYGLKSYGETQQAQQKALEASKQAGTEVGQQELLKEAYKRPQYTQGASALDQALLQRSTGGRAALEGLSEKYKGLSGLFETGLKNVGADIEAQKQLAQSNIAKFAPAEQQAERAILSPIEQRAQQAQTEAQKWAAYQQDLADANLRQETLNALGLQQGQRLFDINLANYFQPEVAQASVQNVATAQERQRYNDLLNFLGTNAGQLGLGQPSYKGASFDLARFQADQAAKQAEFENILRNTNYNITTPNDLAFLEEVRGTTSANAYDIYKGAPVNYSTEVLKNADQNTKELWLDMNRKFLEQQRQQQASSINQQYQDLLNQLNYNRQIGLEA